MIALTYDSRHQPGGDSIIVGSIMAALLSTIASEILRITRAVIDGLEAMPPAQMAIATAVLVSQGLRLTGGLRRQNALRRRKCASC